VAVTGRLGSSLFSDAGRSLLWPRRIVALLAVVAVTAGALVFGRAVLASQGWWYNGFVSETGQPGAPHAGAYRLGILLIAVGLLLLGCAVVPLTLSPRWAVPTAAGLLLLASVLATTSSLVSCSAGCPLPPYERPTFGDLVHASSSVAGMLACVGAMWALAATAADSALRRACRVWLVVAVPLVGFAAVSLLALGRGYSAGTSEKLLLAVIIGWVLTICLLAVFGRLPPGSVRPPP
jgi:Protein of unknown function (DUF998)